MKDYTEDVGHIVRLLDVGDAATALQAAKQLLSQEPSDPGLQSACAGIFVDCGSALRDIEPVNLGVSLIKALLEKSGNLQAEFRVDLEYNLSNGYAAQADLLHRDGAHQAIAEAFQNQKQHLQSVLLERRHLDPDLLPNVLSNYASLLDHLGRTVEAVDHCYECLEIAPDHAVAMGNCGSALQKLLNFSTAHNFKIIYEAWRLIKEANQRKTNLTRLAGKHVIPRHRSALKAFETYIASVIPGGSRTLRQWMFEFEKAHSWKPTPVLRMLKDDRLLLTVNPRPSNCPSEYKDDIYFESIVVPLDDTGDQLFQSLAHTFNHIKEDFATARYLYYQSQSQNTDLVEVSTITSYMDTLDYADFGLRSGFLKASLRLAVDLLDKCAGFINLYLRLGHPEDQVSLNNVWYTDRNYKKGIHPVVDTRLSLNQYLAAVYDLNRDLFLGKYPVPLKNLRNSATHKRLVLFLYGSLEVTDTGHSLEDFQEVTRFLLRMAKATIIYLVGVVMLEEKLREAERQSDGSESRVAPLMPFKVGFGLSDEFDKPE